MTLKLQDKKCKYLIDTSAFYPLLVSGRAFNNEECAVSSLTQFEVGNVLWRENKQKKLKDPARVAAIFSEALDILTYQSWPFPSHESHHI
ncbi:MAG: type II toxin-antitoxin system VapC family toxin [Crenarchaeota archaeon]|nr:type II toxin-antitoxin system VapC family toxin [Thermoproteota archaeon]